MLLPAHDTGLFTDLYELTMAASYLREGMDEPATFSLFIRNYPPDRAYFVAAGLETVLEYLEQLQFPSEALDYLRVMAGGKRLAAPTLLKSRALRDRLRIAGGRDQASACARAGAGRANDDAQRPAGGDSDSGPTA